MKHPPESEYEAGGPEEERPSVLWNGEGYEVVRTIGEDQFVLQDWVGTFIVNKSECREIK